MPQTPLTQADALALFRRVVPSNYSGPMVDQPGEAPVQGVSAEMARASSSAIESLGTQGHITTASIGAFATGSVTFTRSSTPTLATINSGTTISTAEGLVFVTTADAGFAIGIATSTVAARCKLATFAGNVSIGVIRTVVKVLVPPTQPTLALGTVTVDNAAAFSDGKSVVLELHALNRGLYPQSTEAESELRDRIRTIVEQITVPNVLLVANRAMAPSGKLCEMDEPFDIGGAAKFQLMFLDSDFLDLQTHDEVLTSGGEAAGCFYIRVPLIPTTIADGFLDGGMFYDVVQGFDQEDLFIRGLYAAVIRAVESVKAAGVHVVFIPDPTL